MPTRKDEESGVTNDSNPENSAEQVSARQDTEPREWSSQKLFGDRREVLITHGQDVYRLRITRNGKLILHK